MANDGARKSGSDQATTPDSGAKPDVSEEKADRQDVKKPLFPVVGIGASAGGLDAFKRFLEQMPVSHGIAWVLIQHLDPTHESLMASLLSKYTEMQVVQVDENMPIRPDRVYIIPPKKFLRITDNNLFLDEPIKHRGVRMPVDYFFRSLSENRREQGICVIMTGTGSDGSLGLREVKAQGGLTVVQKPETAEYDGMPRSAIATGMVDLILPIEEMRDAILNYIEHPYANGDRVEPDLNQSDPQNFRTIINLLRAHTEYDFRSYKKGTLSRRIQRRVGLNNYQDVSDYVKALRQDPSEVRALFKDLLISVTRFFRDTEAWHALLEHAIRAMIEAKRPSEPIRVWVPGCATGEEAYSIAILLLEEMEQQRKSLNVQIFATDIDEDAIAIARAGRYPGSIAADVSPARLERFFIEEGDGFQVTKRLREMSVFAVQNLISDPPFSNLDLVACRNVMIYLESEIQRRMMELFNFSLKENGLLFLGTSESIGRFGANFKEISSTYRIYRRTGPIRRGKGVFPITTRPRPDEDQEVSNNPKPQDLGEPNYLSSSLVDSAQSLLVDRFAPACVFVNRRNEVQYFSGPVRNYLDIPRGEPTVDLVSMALDGLRSKLRGLLARASAENELQESAVRGVMRDGHRLTVNVRVEPVAMGRAGEPAMLVSFRDLDSPKKASDTAAKPTKLSEAEETRISQLEYELQATREDLQSTIEELETSNEELKASNEEVMSMNEELQSTNEELETSREELQSLNEELSTVNNQLEEKVDELEAANNDLTNLLTSTHIATIFLDQNMRIRRFTPACSDVLHIIDSDIGRQISDLAPRVNDPSMLKDAKRVLDKLTPAEAQVHNGGDHWYIRRIRPYRTRDNKIEGVVVTFTDVTDMRAMAEQLRRRGEQHSSVAKLGSIMLDLPVELVDVFDRAVALVAENCDVPLCKLLRFRPESGDFKLVSGVGWEKGLVGEAVVGGGANSQAGYTLLSAAPVMVDNLKTERRFSGPELLLDHGVKSGVSVVVGPVDRPWGVLGAHTTDLRKFSRDDASFLQMVANLLWQFVQHQAAVNEVKRERQELADLADAVPVWIKRLDRKFRYEFVNDAFALDHGRTREDVIGKTAREITGRRFADARPHIEKALKGEPENHEFSVSVNGAERQKLAHYVPRRNEKGNVVGIYAVTTDITEQRVLREAAEAARWRLQLALNAGNMGIWEWWPDTGQVRWDERQRRLFGVARESETTSLEAFLGMIHPEDLDRLQTATARCKNESDSFTEEFRIVRADGAVRWLFGTGLLVHEDGVRKMIGLNFDITEEKREEERKNMLMAELDHRVRNILSSVLAIASQSAHDDSTIGGFLDAFTGRVNALAHAHTLLSRSGWQGASVLNLIRNALVPYESNGNVKTDGEPVLLRPGASQLCAMALHELATNAAKYGALSSSNGSVAVSWAIADGRSKDRKLVIDWRESGGPKVVEPARRGFGTMVLQEMLKYELNADVKTTFAPKGLTCRISIPLEQILALPVSDDSPASDGRELPSPRT